MAATMHARNTISASLAECFVTIENNRYNFMQAINLEAKTERKKTEVPILGKTGLGNRSTSWKGTGSAKFYYNTTIFRELMARYKDKWEDIYFDIQITNFDDSTTTVGQQTIILKDCNIDGGIIAKFDAAGETLDEEMNFTFEDFEIQEKFKTIDGME